MSVDLEVNLDFDTVLNQVEGNLLEIQQELEASVEMLALSAHAKVSELAAERLHSRLHIWQEHFTIENSFAKVDNNTYVITIPRELEWIEDGQDAHSMLPALLSSPKAKVAKDGSRYIVVPFKHNKGPTKQPLFAQQVTKELRSKLRKIGVPYSKMETDHQGRPRLGKLHSFNFGGPKRPHWTSPVLDGVRIYQKMVKDKRGRDVVQRDIMTFRVASSKHFGLKWEYPGIPGEKFLVQVQHWAEQEWETKIVPEILAKYQQ